MFDRQHPLLRLALVATLAATGVIVTAGGSSPASAAGGFESLASPQRIADTRPSGDTVDGLFEKTGPVGQGMTLQLQVAGRAGIPADADAAVLNVTVANSTRRGFITAYPCDQPQPNAANLNYAQGQIIANAVFAKLDPEGKTCLFTSSQTNLIVDATGSLPDGAFDALASPQRIADTRPTGETVDDLLQKSGPNAAGTALKVQVTGRAGVPDGAEVAVLNITVINPERRGFVTLYPCDQDLPLAANLNHDAGDVVANSVVARLDPSGATCVHTSARTNIVVDVTGTLPTETFVALDAPQRLAETRVGQDTADGIAEGIEFRRAGLTLELPVAGRVAIPDDASAVVLNITTLGSASNGFVTAHPRNSDRPNAANLNYAPGQVIANTVVAKLGGDGKVCLFTSSDVEMIVDVSGYLVGDAPVDDGTRCPLEIRPTDTFPSASYPVGQFQVPPGRYIKAATDGGVCDIDRRENAPPGRPVDFRETFATTGTFSGGQTIMDILPGDAYMAFEGSESCGLLVPYVPPTTPPSSFPSTFEQGDYVVGHHVAPGTYTANVGFGQICVALRVRHWEGFFSAEGVNGMIVERVERLSEGPVSITVQPSDLGVRFGGCVWNRS
ncbi:MAG: hypothetical protein ACE37B_13185 [Ilumatobacter sp.]|uniref:hypothetical protein n=1 Tax=Ilumatobacter sp. TaxID=1967498 RepID=UPI00391BF6AC